MSTPPNATSWPEAMDPSALKEWIMDLSPWLETGETIESYEVTLSPEAIAAGLLIHTGASDASRQHKLIEGDRMVELWFYIEAPDRANPAFDGSGTAYPMTIFFTTNSVPSRDDERTFLLKVAQQ